VHFEAGAIGQRIYLAAKAIGLGATGIWACHLSSDKSSTISQSATRLLTLGWRLENVWSVF
jgi:hypothetical protein